MELDHLSYLRFLLHWILLIRAQSIIVDIIFFLARQEQRLQFLRILLAIIGSD